MQVFISYDQTDGLTAKKVADGLEKLGLKAWYFEREILPGQNWAEAVSKALKQSRAMVVLLSRASLRSVMVRHDIEYALGEATFSHRLIPVIIGPPEKLPEKNIPWILKSLQVVKLPERGNFDKEIKEIADALKAAKAA